MALSVRNLHHAVLSWSEKRFCLPGVALHVTRLLILLLLFFFFFFIQIENWLFIRDIIRLHVWRGRAGPGTIKFASFENRHWHNECFVCSKCHVSLVGQGFLLDGADIVCSGCAPAWWAARRLLPSTMIRRAAVVIAALQLAIYYCVDSRSSLYVARNIFPKESFGFDTKTVGQTFCRSCFSYTRSMIIVSFVRFLEI